MNQQQKLSFFLRPFPHRQNGNWLIRLRHGPFWERVLGFVFVILHDGGGGELIGGRSARGVLVRT